MPDLGIPVNEQLSAADRAVEYLLHRVQFDADLRHVCGPGTQSFRLLVQAEAARLDKPEEEVYERRSQFLAPRHHPQEAEVVRLRKELESMERKVRHG